MWGTLEGPGVVEVGEGSNAGADVENCGVPMVAGDGDGVNTGADAENSD